MVLEVALNGRADCIVTHNVRDFQQVFPKFGIRVLTPGALLERIRK
jgi:predicted nucleic acid-binding protein